MKLVTQLKLRGIHEFLKDVLPRLGTQWAESREQLGGRGMQPAPWMWQEAQVMLNNKVFVDDGDALFFHQGMSSRKRGPNGKAIRDYPPIEVADVTRWKETFAAINEGRRVTWAQFLSLLRIHRVTAEFCTCATYSTLGICDGILLWLLVKEPGFTVPLRTHGSTLASGPLGTAV